MNTLKIIKLLRIVCKIIIGIIILFGIVVFLYQMFLINFNIGVFLTCFLILSLALIGSVISSNYIATHKK